VVDTYLVSVQLLVGDSEAISHLRQCKTKPTAPLANLRANVAIDSLDWSRSTALIHERSSRLFRYLEPKISRFAKKKSLLPKDRALLARR
jgi:hypothetical protein